jgi:homoserine kinase type II
MAVYTALSDSDVEDFLARYRVGTLVDFTGIRDGVENSNFFVTTSDDAFVLTIFEKHDAEEVPYFLNLTAHLAEHDVPCAHPIADRNGAYLQSLFDKPAALVERLPGRTLDQPNRAQCEAVGGALAKMHVAGESFDEVHPNVRGPRWWFAAARELGDRLPAEDRAVLDEELRFQASQRHLDLPRGTIHADLFCDNVLFEGDRLAGMIDFYYACDDCLLYDVAITANDWCTGHDGAFDAGRLEALLTAYHRLRPFTGAEDAAWGTMLRAGALRFWLSRLLDLHFPRPAEVPHVKDPDEYRRVLLARREHTPSLVPGHTETAP